MTSSTNYSSYLTEDDFVEYDDLGVTFWKLLKELTTEEKNQILKNQEIIQKVKAKLERKIPIDE